MTAILKEMTCRHCSAKFGVGPHSQRGIYRRGLCYACSTVPSVWSKYPSDAARQFVSRGVGLGNCYPPIAPTPTLARPGSPEKLIVMMRRVEAGFQPCHPEDRRE